MKRYKSIKEGYNKYQAWETFDDLDYKSDNKFNDKIFKEWDKFFIPLVKEIEKYEEVDDDLPEDLIKTIRDEIVDILKQWRKKKI